jgi:DNA-binding transcriptional regulator YiaG
MSTNSITIEGKKYVVITQDEYDRLRGESPAGAVDAIAFAQKSIAADLKVARETAGLSQGQLAAKLKVSQPMVSSVESGRVRAPVGYVEKVLKACTLPTRAALPEGRLPLGWPI